jgi:hypothetical protein
MKWVYSVGSEKKRILPVISVPKPSFGGLFSSIFSSLSGNSTPQRTVTPLPPPEEPKTDLLAINESAVALTVYSAQVTTKLDRKFSAALQRSTKKEPPSKLRYELIYVSSDVLFRNTTNVNLYLLLRRENGNMMQVSKRIRNTHRRPEVYSKVSEQISKGMYGFLFSL